MHLNLIIILITYKRQIKLNYYLNLVRKLLNISHICLWVLIFFITLLTAAEKKQQRKGFWEMSFFVIKELQSGCVVVINGHVGAVVMNSGAVSARGRTTLRTTNHRAPDCLRHTIPDNMEVNRGKNKCFVLNKWK